MSLVGHKRFVVSVAAHEANDPARCAWRIQHAAETFAIVCAYFETDASGQVARNENGEFRVHAPSWSTLDGLRQMFEHEGLTVVCEDVVPGHGIRPEDAERLRSE